MHARYTATKGVCTESCDLFNFWEITDTRRGHSVVRLSRSTSHILLPRYRMDSNKADKEYSLASNDPD